MKAVVLARILVTTFLVFSPFSNALESSAVNQEVKLGGTIPAMATVVRFKTSSTSGSCAGGSDIYVYYFVANDVSSLQDYGAHIYNDGSVFSRPGEVGIRGYTLYPALPVGTTLSLFAHAAAYIKGDMVPCTNQAVRIGTITVKAGCPSSGKPVSGTIEALNDGCYEGCEVRNLSPTQNNNWVSTLQGLYTGKTCEESPTVNAVKSGKMLACGTTGSSDYKTKTENPIDFAIGNKYFHATDYRGNGTFPIVFNRSYNSLNLGWRYAYTQRIERQVIDLIAVHRPGGQTYEFQLKNGLWVPDPDVTARLEAVTNSDGNPGGWHYILPNNIREKFDANGRLLSIRNSSGLEQSLTYSSGGDQFVITDSQGKWLQVTLENNGLLATSIVDAQGRTTAYQYNDRNLTRITYPDDTTKQYLYEVPQRPWLITGIIDENGIRSHTVAYDSQGRAIMSELANGANRVVVSYNDDGTTTLTNALGKRTTFQFQTFHGVKKIIHVEGEPTQTCQGTAMDYTFDDNGFLLEKTDARGFITQYTRNINGRELSRTEAAGTPEERTITTEWHPQWNLLIRITEAGKVTEFSYDEKGQLLSQSVSSNKQN